VRNKLDLGRRLRRGLISVPAKPDVVPGRIGFGVTGKRFFNQFRTRYAPIGFLRPGASRAEVTTDEVLTYPNARNWEWLDWFVSEWIAIDLGHADWSAT